MKDWKRTLAVLLAAIMLVMPFGVTAEPELELNVPPEADAGLELEIAPESVGDVTDLELELPEGLELGEIELDDLDAGITLNENLLADGMEAEGTEAMAPNSFTDGDYNDYEFKIDTDGRLYKYNGDGGDVVIPDGVTSIGDGVFRYSSVTSVSIPDSVTSIGKEAFMMSNLKSLTIPNSVTSIGEDAFSNTDITSIVIPESITYIGEWFSGCNELTTVKIHNKVTSIQGYAFCLCDRLNSITIPSSVSYIGHAAFWDCGLSTVIIHAKEISIDDEAFMDSHPTFYTYRDSDVYKWAKNRKYDVVDISEGALSETSLEMEYGDTYSLTVCAPDGYTVTWSSSDGKVATVKDGTVTAVGEGSCTITASLNNGKALECAVTVEDPAELSETELSMEVGSNDELEVYDLGNRTVTWSSSDGKVATVKGGTVTAIGEGTCTITATLSNGKALKCAVTVKDPAELSETELSMGAGSTFELVVYELCNRTVTWSSSDSSIAYVDNGTVYANEEGECIIYATISNSKVLECEVSVYDDCALYEYESSHWDDDDYSDDGIEIHSAILYVSETLRLIVINKGFRSVTWSSSDDKVASVKGGTVTAIREGTCTITATPDNGKTLRCALTVNDPAVLSKTEKSISIGETYKLKVYKKGNRTVTWSSSDKKVATVKAGTVTAIKAGKCTITATLSNGKQLKCVLTVNDSASLSKTKLSMNAGMSYELKVNKLGNRKVAWTSSDKKVARVTDGMVTAISEGSCTITADIKDGKTFKCEVTVKDAAKLSEKKLSINVGETYKLKVSNLGNRTVTWTSSDKKVATVKNGTVTAIGEGKCTITAKPDNGKKLKCALTVKDPAALSKVEKSMNVGETYKLKVDKLGNRTVTWTSSNKKVATVKAGTVTAIGEGKCTITAMLSNGKKLKCALTVKDPAVLSETEKSLNIGDTYKLKVYNRGNRTVTWSSSNKKVATVKAGTVTATKAGKCTITATLSNGKALKCTLTVKDPAGITKTKLSMNAGSTYALKIYKLGNRKVTWTSSDKKVATVKAGTVTAIKAGECTITAKVIDGKSFKCKVTVKDAAKFNKTKLSLEPGDSQTLKISGLYGREVTWSSSDKKIATVEEGKVTAVYIGSCTVTAQIKNGKKLSCSVTVTDAAALSNDKLTISSIDTDRIALTGGLNRKVTWSTSNKDVVEITNSDNDAASIRAVKNGTATITAKVEGGKTLKCEVKVVDPLTITVDEIDEESVYNELWVYFNNHSNKKITYVTLDIAQYNNRGDKLESPYDYYYLNENVFPHDSLYHYYWVNDDTKKVRIKITEVTFADKTTWRP